MPKQKKTFTALEPKWTFVGNRGSGHLYKTEKSEINMENLRQTLIALLKNPKMKVDPQWAQTVMEKYPYFTLISALLLNRNGDDMDSQTKKKLLSKASIYAGDVDAYLSYANAAIGGGLASFYPAQQERHISTTEAITTFLDNYGSKHPQEDQLLERMIFNPIPDYAGVLEVEERAELERKDEGQSHSAGVATSSEGKSASGKTSGVDQGGKDEAAEDSAASASGQEGEEALQGQVPQMTEQDKLIDAFIAKMAPPSYTQEPMPEEIIPDTSVEVSEPSVSNDTSLRESLAKVYIRKGKYSKAYEIISELNLNFPQKNVYFADQLRYLEKLMLLEQLKGK